MTLTKTAKGVIIFAIILLIIFITMLITTEQYLGWGLACLFPIILIIMANMSDEYTIYK